MRVDIFFHNHGKRVAIEVKKSTEGLYDGIGKAIAYLMVVDESWLAVTTKDANTLKKINRLIGLQFHIFDWKKKELTYGSRAPKVIEVTRYVCPICGETITPQKRFVKLHMKVKHECACDFQELKDAIKALREDKYFKAKIEYYKKHSSSFDYATI